MKKIAILFMILLLTGCTVVRIDTTSIDNIVNVVLSKENSIFNRVGKGYKYYIPRGVSYIDTIELNDKLYSNGIYYYLYVDAVSYYYKSKINYVEDNKLYYSKKITGDKEGYLEIKGEDDGYYIVFVYNYAKIEAKTTKDKLEEVVLNASYILSTIKFNDNIISLMLDNDYFTNKEEQYDEFSKKNENNNFLVDEEIEEK